MAPRRPERSQLTVDELTLYVQGLFLSDLMLKSLIVAGEIAEFKRHTSGHCYFTLLGKESRVLIRFYCRSLRLALSVYFYDAILYRGDGDCRQQRDRKSVV